MSRMRIVDYQLVEVDAAYDALEELVKTEMKKGWQPLGGVCFVHYVGDYSYVQAMVRYETAAPGGSVGSKTCKAAARSKKLERELAEEAMRRG